MVYLGLDIPSSWNNYNVDRTYKTAVFSHWTAGKEAGSTLLQGFSPV
jgi:hypothetical protein